MASSTAQIHVLGGVGFSSSSSRKHSFSFSQKTVFFGQNLRSQKAAFLRCSNTTRRRYSTGPLRVVNEKVVGIDLGTTNSAVAAMEGGKPTIVTNAEGQRTTPSVVAYTKNGDRLVGQIAKRQAVVNPENTFFSVKRFIGRKMSEVDEESKQVFIKYLGMRMEMLSWIALQLASSLLLRRFLLRNCEWISYLFHIFWVLRKLVDDASKFLNDKVTKAVVTVPAYFNDSQRTATKDAGRIAGLDVLRIINEPTAASLAYGFEKKNNETILVFDLGGGTFDVSVLEVGDGVFEVLSTSGDTHLGGDDFDKRIVDWLASDFKRDEGIDLLKDKQALQRLTETAEKAKMELSSLTQTNISIETTLTRAKFEELCSDLLDRLKTPVENSLRDAKLSFKDLDEVILVGGSTRIPAVQELVKKMTGKDPNVTVNPDEVVALGAAVQAGVLSGDVSDIVLLDVTPLSLGLETLGGVMTKIIPRNTTLPTSKSEVFSTAADGQTSVEINVLQGEREFVRDNKSLGSFRLDGSGKKQDITITGASTLPSDEVERMVNEAEKFAKEDKEKRDAIDTKNQADSVVYQTEKQLKELGDKVPAPVKESQPGAGGSGPAPGSEAGPLDSSNKGPDGDVIDADFTDSKVNAFPDILLYGESQRIVFRNMEDQAPL
ncbi:hypothetical protein GH714_023117 [Hevea brasiliensis]|uniref:Uncharacterized protein n=1 Tax=Hevea brasiliensis TaxID=3981 RepID=A0A6A6N337_HEVBR|nr:hypothetical protein GH714_023117 [Hevea brasiliensis]